MAKAARRAKRSSAKKRAPSGPSRAGRTSPDGAAVAASDMSALLLAEREGLAASSSTAADISAASSRNRGEVRTS